MKKQLIRLTENDLHKIVENSVRRALMENETDEGWRDFAKGAWNKLKGDASSAAKSGYEAGANKVNAMGNAARNKVNAMGNAAKSGMNAMGNAARNKVNAMGNAAKSGMNAMGNAAKNGMNAIGNAAKNGMNAAKSGMNAMGNAAKNYVNDVKAAGQQASNVADAKKAIGTIQDLVERGILGPKVGRMVIGSLKKYGNQ